jgi:hypothetical protein
MESWLSFCRRRSPEAKTDHIILIISLNEYINCSLFESHHTLLSIRFQIYHY